MTFSLIQMANIVLVLIILFIAFKYLESFWSYRISKPHAWEAAQKQKRLSKKLVKIERRYRDKVRFYNLWFQVERLKKLKVSGAFAELGVHQGETARAIHHMDQDRDFYLFDTFEGFSEEDLVHESQKDGRFSTEMFADTNLDEVKQFIDGNENLRFKPGFFPDTTKGLTETKFALVHLDADLYVPTIAALQYFYPRMSPGGVIIVHDYNHTWHGIPKAVDEFLQTIPESLTVLPDWQGSAMIIRNT